MKFGGNVAETEYYDGYCARHLRWWLFVWCKRLMRLWGKLEIHKHMAIR